MGGLLMIMVGLIDGILCGWGLIIGLIEGNLYKLELIVGLINW